MFESRTSCWDEGQIVIFWSTNCKKKKWPLIMAISLSSISLHVYFQVFFVFVFRFSNRLWWRRHKDCEMFNKDDQKRQQKGVIIINSSFMISHMPLPLSLLCKSSLLHNKKEHEEDESSQQQQQQHKKKRMQWHVIEVVWSLLDV